MHRSPPRPTPTPSLAPGKEQSFSKVATISEEKLAQQVCEGQWVTTGSGGPVCLHHDGSAAVQLAFCRGYVSLTSAMATAQDAAKQKQEVSLEEEDEFEEFEVEGE